MPTATYCNYELIIDLVDCNIDLGVFRATQEDFLKQLREPRRIPDGLLLLIGKLFQQKVTTGCIITYGKTMTLRLSPTCSPGYGLLDGVLEKFEEIYVSITGHSVDTSWASSSRRHMCKSQRDYSGILGSIVQIVDLAVDAIVPPAALKELFGDSE